MKEAVEVVGPVDAKATKAVPQPSPLSVAAKGQARSKGVMSRAVRFSPSVMNRSGKKMAAGKENASASPPTRRSSKAKKQVMAPSIAPSEIKVDEDLAPDASQMDKLLDVYAKFQTRRDRFEALDTPCVAFDSSDPPCASSTHICWDASAAVDDGDDDLDLDMPLPCGFPACSVM